MTAEWRPFPFPDGIEQFYSAMIRFFGIGKTELDPDRVKDKRIAALMSAMEEAKAADVTTAMNQTLKLYRKKIEKRDFAPYEAIAVEESVLVHLWRLVKGEDLTADISPDLQLHILQLVE